MRSSLLRRLSLAVLVVLPVGAARAADRIRARRLYEDAFDRYLQGNFKRAMVEINDSISEDADFMPAYTLRARLFKLVGDAPLMLKDADKVARKLGGSLSILDAEQLTHYGTALLLRGQTEHALPAFNAALQIDANSAEALAGRARVFRARGDLDLALGDLNQLLDRPDQHMPVYYYDRAEALFSLGKYDAAVEDLTNALRLNKLFYPAYGLVGAALAQKGDYKRSLAAYNKAAALNPEYAFPYLGRAALRLAQGVDEAAFTDLEQAIRVDAHDFAPYYNRAEAYLRRGNRDEALGDYRKAIQASSLDAQFAIKIGDRLSEFLLWKEAVDAYTRAYALAGGQAERSNQFVKRSLTRKPEWTKSKQRQGEAAPADPGEPEVRATLSPIGVAALIHRSRAFEGLKDDRKALDDLAEAIERAPASAEAWAARGTLHMRLNRDSQAVSDLNQAIKISPKSAAARVARGRFYARHDKPKMALEDFNVAAEVDPKDAEAFNDRGALYANALNDPQKALQDIEQAMRLSPKDSSYQYNLGMLRLKEKQFTGALDAFTRALQLGGPPARILAARADAYSQLGDHTSALQDVQAALEKDPKYSMAFDKLGAIRLRTHQYEQAVRDLNQALLLDPKNSWALVHRGRAYGALGTLHSALRDFESAVALDPHSKEAWTDLCQARRLLKDPSGGIVACGRAIDIDAYHAPAYLQRGLCRLAMRNAEGTLDDLGTVAALGYHSAQLFLAQAVVHTAMRQYHDAHADYMQAQQVDPSVHTSNVGFAASRGETDEFFNAVADLEPIIRNDSSQPYLFVVRGDALANAERYDKAIVEYTKAMELDGQNADAYIARGVALMAQDALDAAQQDFLRALEINPNDAPTRIKLATALTLKHDYKGALLVLQKALTVDPHNAEAYLRAGNAHYFNKEYSKALEDYLLAVKYDPASAAAANGAGLGYFALKRYAEALEHFSRAIALNPDNDRYFRNRAATYTNMRSYGNATAEFKNASYLNRDPSLVDEYKKLIDQSESHSANSKS